MISQHILHILRGNAVLTFHLYGIHHVCNSALQFANIRTGMFNHVIQDLVRKFEIEVFVLLILLNEVLDDPAFRFMIGRLDIDRCT